MGTPSIRSPRGLVMALVLVVVVIAEELVMYKVRQQLREPWLRAAVALALYGIGFAIATAYLEPRLRRVLERIRRSSRRTGGEIGLLVFWVCAIGAVYWAVLVLETRGARGLLPIGLQ